MRSSPHRAPSLQDDFAAGGAESCRSVVARPAPAARGRPYACGVPRSRSCERTARIRCTTVIQAVAQRM